ncbi:hypothetical protein FKM82_028222 [Ascaphus truei]
MDVVLGTSFSVNVDSINNPNDPFVINGRKLFDFSILSPLIILTVLFPCIIPALEKMNFCFFSSSAIQFFTDAIKRFRNTRQKGIQERVDFLQLMIDSQTNENDSEEEKHGYKGNQMQRFDWLLLLSIVQKKAGPTQVKSRRAQTVQQKKKMH